MDLTTIVSWLDACGWSHEAVDATTIQIFREPGQPPNFFLRLTDHWILLAIIPVLDPDAHVPRDLSRRLLAVNRDMRIAKFGYDEDGDVSLSAELPTESLQASELRDAIERIARYVEHYRAYLTAPAQA